MFRINRKSGPIRQKINSHRKCTPETFIFEGWKAELRGLPIPVKPRRSKHAAVEFVVIRSKFVLDMFSSHFVCVYVNAYIPLVSIFDGCLYHDAFSFH